MVLVAATAAAVLVGCDIGPEMGMHHARFNGPFASNGERIYFIGTSDSGEPVSYVGGNLHFRMMGGGCATCHGDRREGGRMSPRFWLKAPPLTRHALFDDHGAANDHGDHAAYTDKTLRRAISRGLDAAGEPLDEAMPHWSMSEADWRDLMDYLDS